jgi:flagella basal body P-ring formation protein FlgA
MRIIVLAALAATSLFCADCVPITGDRILGSDLALANPAFSRLPAAMTIAYAPAPGQKRIFAEAELLRIARANRIELEAAAEVCFAIPMRNLESAEVLASMRRVLPAEAELSIVELTKTPVPAGTLEFSLNGLEPEAQAGRMWRGYVRYSQTLRMPIWARVELRYRVEAVVAGRDLQADLPIGRASLRIQRVSVGLDRAQPLARQLDEVVGRVPKRGIPADTAIPLGLLDVPPAIKRGEAIKVEVRSGAARIQIDAVAEAPARTGDMVALRNPVTGKRFTARVESGSLAVIQLGGAL